MTARRSKGSQSRQIRRLSARGRDELADRRFIDVLASSTRGASSPLMTQTTGTPAVNPWISIPPSQKSVDTDALTRLTLHHPGSEIPHLGPFHKSMLEEASSISSLDKR